jgi:hypothetical protein
MFKGYLPASYKKGPVITDSGTYSTVRCSIDSQGRKVALKIVKDHKLDGSWIREILALRNIHHKNIIEPHAVYFWYNQRWSVVTVMPLYNTTLLWWIKHSSMETRQLHAQKIAQALASAVQAVHACGFIHMDIKPENIMLTDSTEPKLIDFGNSIYIGTACRDKMIVSGDDLMTLWYKPPETFTDCLYGQASDIWSLGCTWYQIFSGRAMLTAGCGQQQKDAIEKFLFNRELYIEPLKIPVIWKSLLRAMLTRSHTARITSDLLLKICQSDAVMYQCRVFHYDNIVSGAITGGRIIRINWLLSVAIGLELNFTTICCIIAVIDQYEKTCPLILDICNCAAVAMAVDCAINHVGYDVDAWSAITGLDGSDIQKRMVAILPEISDWIIRPTIAHYITGSTEYGITKYRRNAQQILPKRCNADEAKIAGIALTLLYWPGISSCDPAKIMASVLRAVSVNNVDNKNDKIDPMTEDILKIVITMGKHDIVPHEIYPECKPIG